MNSVVNTRVSVIVPAHNAAATLGEMIASLRAQTFTGWEAIVVDDGSTDETAAIVAHWAEQEPRIRLRTQLHSGASAARNTGIGAARNDWLLFLDADDWIALNTLEALTQSLAADAGLDAVHCGWAWISPSGETIREGFGPPGDDLFPVLARRPAFVTHACIVRRDLVEAAGAFDPSLATAEDWDLWQRVARCGARFGAVREALAFCRMRVGSATEDAARCLTDGLGVIRRGHRRDPRVSAPDSRYAEGAPAEELPAALFCFLSYYAGLVLGQRGDARSLLQHLADERAPDLSAYDVACTLFDAIPTAAKQPVQSWGELWAVIRPQLSAFLADIEIASGGLALAPRVQRHLERLILQTLDLRQPVTIGRSHGVRIDATRPIADVPVPEGVDRLHCFVELVGEPFSQYEFPAFNVVAGSTIEDAIAPDEAELTRLTDYVLRTHIRAVARNPRFWRALAAFTLRKRTLRLALNFIQKRDGSRRAWLVQWRREAVVFLTRRRAVIGAAPLTEQARRAAAQFAAIVGEEQTRVSESAAKCPMLATCGAGTPNMVSDEPEQSRGDERVAFWENVFTRPNPWGYTSGYERTKYEQTLTMLPHGRLGRVLELACAEGHFTAQLAPRVEFLIAVDISPTALKRAAERCRSLTNVKFAQLDLIRDSFPGRFDLIVCSEVLYFVPDRGTLATIAQRFVNHLEQNGYLLIGHAHILSDEPDKPGFDWPHPFGAKSIGEIIAESTTLRLVREFRTPLYRIQLFQNTSNASAPRPPAEIIESTIIGEMTPEAARQVWWGGRAAGLTPALTERLPILMYHRIASEGPAALARYRVAPERFTDQLTYLRANGYRSVSLAEWADAIVKRQALPDRAVMLTFDDGYRDFLTSAAPLLERYGFSATIFLVADAVGGTAAWDSMYGEPARLLSWAEIRELERDGFGFGSHFLRHVPLTALAVETVVREGTRARAILERELEQPVPAITYPYGDYDPVVGRALRSCGYKYGLTCREDYSRLHDDPMELPRIEVRGTDDIGTFAAKLRAGTEQAAPTTSSAPA